MPYQVARQITNAATIADRHYVMEDGRVVDMIAAADVAQNLDKLQAYLGV
jgi:branched-chain amino acid transport system ATP-binding protein